MPCSQRSSHRSRLQYRHRQKATRSTRSTAAIAEQIGFRNKPNYGPPREGDIQHSLADISRASNELGYQPRAHFHEGLKKTVAWYLEEKQKKEVVGLRG